MNLGVDRIMVTGEYIAEVYDWYRSGKLKVNRTYQRKLVWTLQEKQDLIRSIAKGYPIPLFLLVDREGKGKSLEIIDGLQRLNAIFEFMDNKFSVDIDGVTGFFNTDSCQMTYNAQERGIITKEEPQLNYDLCHNISRYTLAVSTINADESAVEDVFRKINATGRKLEPQELRQAGVTGQFSSMVQDIASKIRGDYTKSNLVDIDDMRAISLSSIGSDYGISITDVFWVKQGIISQDNLRRSRDEELVANLCNCILSGYKAPISADTLDRLYDENGKIFRDNERKLTPTVKMGLIDLFEHVVNDLNKVAQASGKSLMNLWVHAPKCYNKNFVFIIIFLAMSQLYNEGCFIEDYSAMANAMSGIASLELNELITKSDVNWDKDTRLRLITRVKRCLAEFMSRRDYDAKRNQETLLLLSRAAAEEQLVDFKLGITTLTTGRRNDELIEKLVKTLVAMANTVPYTKGMIILGIADNQKDAEDFYRHYGARYIKFNDIIVTGIEQEAARYFSSVDNYKKALCAGVLAVKDKVPVGVLNYILRNMQQVRYDEKVLIVLELATSQPIFFNNTLYVRHDSNNAEVALGSTEYHEVMAKFYTAGANTTKSSVFTQPV